MIKRRSSESGKAAHSPSLVDQVVDAITQMVMNRRLSPESALPAEAELAGRYGVSRTVIREAMRLLSDRGIIEVQHGKRPRVCRPSADVAVRSLSTLLRRGAGSLRDLAEVRIPLESAIAALAARRRTADDLRRLRECLAAQASAASLDAQVEQDVRFHNLLAGATGNVVFAAMLESIGGLLTASRRRTLGRAGNPKALAHHQRILDAVIARDADLARGEMISHLQMMVKDLGRRPSEAKRRRQG